MGQRVMIVDPGGRGHAIAEAIARSEPDKLFIVPGNGGTPRVAESVDIQKGDVAGVIKFAKQNAVSLVVASQDDWLAAGLVDACHAEGLRVFGPTRLAAEIESSKALAKEAMVRAGVPTAPFGSFTNLALALAHVRFHGAPIVVKASGLALGKGSYVCQTVAEAEQALADIMVKRVHKDAGNAVVIEKFIPGPEVSVHAFCDGKDFTLCPLSQDHKAAFDGGRGPNTGGMGVIAPVPWVPERLMQETGRVVVAPILRELARMGRPFVGCLYPGLKVHLNPAGIWVLEYNARPGDPEIQAYLKLLLTPLLDILNACVDGTLAKRKVEWSPGFAACVVLASGGYPDAYKKGLPITGIDAAEMIPEVQVIHAGTKMSGNTLVTDGGRVLDVIATGPTLREAISTAYRGVECIHFEGMQCRHDIGDASLKMAQC